MSRAGKNALKDWKYVYEYSRYDDMKLKGENLKLGKLLIQNLKKRNLTLSEISKLFNKNKQETKLGQQIRTA